MQRYDARSRGKECKAWTPTAGGGPVGQPCVAPTEVGVVHGPVEKGGEGGGKAGGGVGVG